MNYMNANMKYLRKQENMTQQQFADRLGIKRSLLGAYEEGRAKPNPEVLKTISREFNITLDALMTQDLAEIARQQVHGSTAPGSDKTNTPLRVLAITVDSEDRENIELVPEKAAAGYLAGYTDPTYIKELPRFRLPNLPQGTYRAFEIKGDSMIPLMPGSVVIGEYIDDWKQIKDGSTYIILSRSEGIVYKRVFNQLEESRQLLLRSDNPAYPPYSISAEDILEVWQAKLFITSAVPGQDISMEKLMSMVLELQQEVLRLKGGAEA